MPCPFPGMDPYLEMQPFWNDFVPGFLSSIQNSLLSKLLPRYDVRIDEYVFATETQRHLKIIHLSKEAVVTVIELLLPENKVSVEGGIDAYLKKRAELITSGVNLVEIDLLRGGERLPMRGLPSGNYYVYVGRTQRELECDVFAWALKMPLPTIPIPLLPDDEETNLDLAAAFRTTYEAAFYDRRLPYQQPLEPKPSDEEGEWIKQLLSQ